jgi:hypothetical protein
MPPVVPLRRLVPAITMIRHRQDVHRQRLAVDLGLREERDEVVGGALALLLDELREVEEDLGHRLARGLLGRLARLLVLGVAGADHAVGPVEEQVPVGLREPEHPRDHRDRQRSGNRAHEVALAALAEPVDDLARDLLDLGVIALEEAA